MAGEAWDDMETPQPHAGVGPTLRAALIFGCAAVIFALVAAPMAERHVQQAYLAAGPGIDRIATGSVSGQGASTYTIRRSVLQDTPQAVCIIHSTGRRTGNC